MLKTQCRRDVAMANEGAFFVLDCYNCVGARENLVKIFGF